MMTSSALRSLSLANAAIKHALYFLELDAQKQAASYCNYAAEHLQQFALGLHDIDVANQDYESVCSILQSENLTQLRDLWGARVPKISQPHGFSHDVTKTL